jgi:small GTP-binding protein
MTMKLSNVLTKEHTKVLEEERLQIQGLIALLENWESEKKDLERLRETLDQLDEFFLLVFVGEFNSGKSALINALLGESFLKEGVTPTTSQIDILQHGDVGPPTFLRENIRVLQFPVDLLREIHIVDTPGTNAVLREHEAIVREFVPRSDMVIFVTSADRPFTESERAFLETVRQWGKKIVVVINKVDILESDTEIEEIEDFVRGQVQRLLEFEPELFPLSAKRDLLDQQGPDAGGLRQFQDYLFETLSESSRVRIKLLSPLGVARKIAQTYLTRAHDRKGVLEDDSEVLRNVEYQHELYSTDTRAEFQRHIDQVENNLLQMRVRGEMFLDENMRLVKVREMLQSRRMQEAFDQKVVADTPEQIEDHVQEAIDWFIERDLRQWRSMAEALEERRETDALRDAAKEAAGGFAYNRRQLLQSIGVRTESVIRDYDRAGEAARLASTVQESVALVGLVEAGAIGLGILLKALLTTAAADATGLLAAGLLGALGFAIIPYRRGRAKRDFRLKMEELQERLKDVLATSFERELEQSLNRLREAIAPYRRFVLGEEKRLESFSEEIAAIQTKLSALEASIEGL